jgi:hypothetical protein
MRLRLLVTAAALAALIPTYASAQRGTAEGAAAGAAAGGAAGGPVGAVVGGTVGAAVGTAGAIIDPPDEVHTYVMRERVPSVAVEERVVVGQPLPQRVTVHRIPRHDDYAYAVVNDRRVIVEPRTRKVIKVYE